MKKYFNPLNIVFFTSLALIILIIFGIIPREVAFIILSLYLFFIAFYPTEKGVDLFLRSIPFFIALPITESFDNFNMWRLIILLIFVKWLLVEHNWKSFIKVYKSTKKYPILIRLDRVGKSIKKWIKKNKFEVAGILFLFFAATSILVAIDLMAGIRRLIYILNALMLFIVIRSLIIKNKENANGFVKNFAYSGLLAVFFGYLQFVAAYFVPAWVFHYWWGQIVSVGMYGREWGEIVTNFGNTWFSYSGETLRLRMFSSFPDSHSFPIYIIMTLPALFVVAWRKLLVFDYFNSPKNKGSQEKNIHIPLGKLFSIFKRKTILLASIKNLEITKLRALRLQFLRFFLIFVFINLALVLSGTRGIWIASFATLFVLFLFKIFKINKNASRIFLASFLIFLLMFPIYFGIVSFPQFQDTDFTTSASFKRIRSIIDFGETSNQARIYIWQKTIKYITESPVFGIGIGNYPLILNEPQITADAGSSAHNLYLHIASTIGVFGLISFLWMMFELVKISLNHIRQNVKDFWNIYFIILLYSLFWIGAYLMTDATLYDGRALLAFMAMTAVAIGFNKLKMNS